ncbi:acetate--CoA ligase family protein [candidate division CSSED10-310 bacterium]|uniref:Acetate--CoA ligase family protein n=1 Tax=candidate division CSSED10-310 bacterium TaxID=2855610 RepID=A0ABV6Z3P1_UNCC1
MLDALFKPRSIAIIGASNNPFSIGHIVIRNLTDHGFKGPIYPINPKTMHIRSFRTYKSVLEVPDEIDLVNISIAAKYLPQIMEECGQKGVKFAICHTAGFKEVGEEGIAREKALVEIAHKHGIRIFGPNSQGIQNSNPEVSVYANFTFVPMNPGAISIIAQGGGIGEQLKLHLYNVGVGHRMYCSYGNEADLSMPEILEYYGQDEGTKVIIQQIESFKFPAEYLRVASAITPHKPILAIKAGRTSEGSKAVSSHTGSLVDQSAMATAMFRKAGIIEFHDVDRMVKAAIAMERLEPPKGNRIGIVTNTGGPGIQAVDESVDGGLELATWSDEGKARLKETQLPMASLGNPVDVVATGGPDHYFHAVDTLVKEEAVDMVLVFFVTAPFVDLDAIANRICEVTASTKKPVIMVVETYKKYYSLIDKLRHGGVPVYEFAEDGARVLAAMTRYSVLKNRKKEDPPQIEVDQKKVERIISKYQNSYLPQDEAFQVISAYGIPVPRFVSYSGDTAEAANKVGFPCVLKVDSTDVVHKSDEGGVVLDIENEDELAKAFESMKNRFSDPKTRFLLMEQKPGGCEIIIGLTESPGLGSMVMFGLGGVFVEVMKDVMFSVAPLSRPEAREMIEGIKGYQILKGIRGKKGVDIMAIEDLLIRVAKLGSDFPTITDMDLNPIITYPEGTSPVAVDVRIKVK